MYHFQDRIHRRGRSELYLASENAEKMWDALLEAGKDEADSMWTWSQRYTSYGSSNASVRT